MGTTDDHTDDHTDGPTGAPIDAAAELSAEPKQARPAVVGARDGVTRRRLLIFVTCVLLGVLAGAGVFTVAYAEGFSYLSNDPAACANCHIMREQYAGWQAGPHHEAATCNDCHVPHKLLSKYLAKAANGWHHSSAFTLQNYPDPIRIKPGNAEVLEHNCRQCHEDLVSDISGHYGSDDEGPPCVQCHRNVGHGPTR